MDTEGTAGTVDTAAAVPGIRKLVTAAAVPGLIDGMLRIVIIAC